MSTASLRLSHWLALLSFLLVAVTTGSAAAAPASHILRIDPRAGIANGAPLLTTVIEVVEFQRLSSVLAPCANVAGYDNTLECWADQLEKKDALWKPFRFPEKQAHLVVKVEGRDHPATFVSAKEWGASAGEANVGTAWLIALDASASMGARYSEARAVARQFIESMGPNDLMDIMIFGDMEVVHDSRWKTIKERNELVLLLNKQPTNLPAKGRDRPLFNLVKQMTRDAFSDLGGTTGPKAVPLHQAMVFLSNGTGRGDPASASPSAEVFSQYLNKGRFPEENTSLPKMPLPTISIWFPTKGGLQNDLYRNNDAQFMQSLANPEIGGYFSVIREGGVERGKRIIEAVRRRFNAMWLVRWKLACLNPTIAQTFELAFEGTSPPVGGDATFKEVPIGVDPTQWPLDVDFKQTKDEAERNPVSPGGTLKVFGNFCWVGEKSRAEAYFIPAGERPPANANNRDPNMLLKVVQRLVADNMRGGATEVGEAFAAFQVPDNDRILEGSGESAVVRVIVYDNRSKRASSIDEKTVLTLKGGKKPWNLLLIGGISGGVIVLLLLLIVVMRGGGGGGGGKKRGATPPPAPVVAGPMPGAPPYGGGAPGGGYGGGYGQQHAGGGDFGGGAPVAGFSPVASGAEAPPVLVAAPADVVQVRCPQCQLLTMVTPGRPSVCFSCGQPIAAEAMQGGAGPMPVPSFRAHRSDGAERAGAAT